MWLWRWQKCQLWRVDRQSRTGLFFKFCPNNIFGSGEGTSGLVCWLIHRCTGAWMIYYPWKRCVQSHVTSWNFAKFNGARWRHSSNGTLIGYHVWPIEWHHCQCPWMTLKVNFAVWSLSIPRETAQIYKHSATCALSAVDELLVNLWVPMISL